MAAPPIDSRDRPRWSFPIARISGITVRVHVTFLIIVVLVALSASAAGETEVEAVGWLLALFACVVVHEFGHSLVAQSKGVVVREIDLLPIGGMSRMEALPERWQDEAAIAIAGPLTSLAIALAGFVIAVVLQVGWAGSGPWSGAWPLRLAWLNLLIGAFNLLPAFPLDGGRVLRSLLERTRTRESATAIAAHAGRILAGAMILVGLFVNLWLVIIGVFVWVAGRAEELAVLVHAALGSVPARVLAVPCPVHLSSALTVFGAQQVAHGSPQVGYPVDGPDGRFLGAVAAGQIWSAPLDARLGDLAVADVVPASTSLESLVERGTGATITVVDRGTIVGLISPEILDGYVRQRLAEEQRAAAHPTSRPRPSTAR